MRHLHLVLGPLLLVAAFGTSGAPVTVASASDGPSSRAPSFPGGGSILFMPARGWSLGDAAFGIVTSAGEVGGYLEESRRGPGYATWDPADPRRIFVGPVHGNELARFSLAGGSLNELDTWRRTPYLQMVRYSPEGRYMAERSTASAPIRMMDLESGHGADLPAPRGALVGWSPSGDVLLAAHHGRTLLIDRRSGNASRFIDRSRLSRRLPADLRPASLDPRSWSWSADGRYFSAVARRVGRTAIIIGTSDGRIADVVRLGSADLSGATWSPVEHTLAFMLSGKAAWRAAVYDVGTARRATVAEDVGNWWPPAWSRDGRWLLMDDVMNERWLFAATDGSEVRTYPRLGSNPRWGGSSFASPSASVAIQYC